jgi:ribosomal protein S18 acetylase RimI-like enzyme
MAFASDPIARWFMPRPADFLALFPLVVRHMGGGAFGEGAADWAGDGAAVALWLPPGVGPDMESLGAALATHEAPEGGAEFFDRQMAFHPEAPHWYLPFIGVDPAGQGRGLGSALLAHGVARADAIGMPCYLESTNPRNLPLYERFGFRVIGKIQVANSPPMHPMWREARG